MSAVSIKVTPSSEACAAHRCACKWWVPPAAPGNVLSAMLRVGPQLCLTCKCHGLVGLPRQEPPDISCSLHDAACMMQDRVHMLMFHLLLKPAGYVLTMQDAAAECMHYGQQGCCDSSCFTGQRPALSITSKASSSETLLVV